MWASEKSVLNCHLKFKLMTFKKTVGNGMPWSSSLLSHSTEIQALWVRKCIWGFTSLLIRCGTWQRGWQQQEKLSYLRNMTDWTWPTCHHHWSEAVLHRRGMKTLFFLIYHTVMLKEVRVQSSEKDLSEQAINTWRQFGSSIILPQEMVTWRLCSKFM